VGKSVLSIARRITCNLVRVFRFCQIADQHVRKVFISSPIRAEITPYSEG
jgi:hypothetical protein